MLTGVNWYLLWGIVFAVLCSLISFWLVYTDVKKIKSTKAADEVDKMALRKAKYNFAVTILFLISVILGFIMSVLEEIRDIEFVLMSHHTSYIIHTVVLSLILTVFLDRDPIWKKK
jgi:uncharacterized membrane protein